MTDSMIPYSFIPGTKAKAGEVNANFIALANLIANYKSAASEDLSEVSEQLQEQITQLVGSKADKTELNKFQNVVESGTNLNNYLKAGSYVFSSGYTPYYIPKGYTGTLIVTGDKDNGLTQIWISDEEYPEVFVRNYQNGTWQVWKSILGSHLYDNAGYIKMPNGFKIQWCYGSKSSTVTYPIAYSVVSAAVFAKHGFANRNGDTGFSSQDNTGFSMGTVGIFDTLNWIVVGY